MGSIIIETIGYLDWSSVVCVILQKVYWLAVKGNIVNYRLARIFYYTIIITLNLV